MTQTLEEVALAFCREVLDMRTAQHNPAILKTDIPSVYGHLGGDDTRFLSFRYTDLNAVMDAVRSFCEDRGFHFWLQRGPGTDWWYEAGVRVPDRDGVVCIDKESACMALLSACVAAQRKIKGEV